jgi:hypothetical protein
MRGSTSRMTPLIAAQQQPQVHAPSGLTLGASHKMVVIAEAPTVEAVLAFAMDTGPAQWNSVEIFSSWGFEEAIKQANAMTPINWEQPRLAQRRSMVLPHRSRATGPLRSSRSCLPVGP